MIYILLILTSSLILETQNLRPSKNDDVWRTHFMKFFGGKWKICNNDRGRFGWITVPKITSSSVPISTGYIEKLDQIFHYTRCITPKARNEFTGPISASFARGKHNSFRRNVGSGGEPLANTVFRFKPAWGLNLRPPASEKNAFYLSN